MTDSVRVEIKRLPNGDGLAVPSYQTEHAAGMDLCAAVSADVVLTPGGSAIIPTGFAKIGRAHV